MTGKLYCPFCHRALARHGVQCKEYGVCRDENCPSERNFLPIEIWQALIDGKKAQEALKKARDMYKKTLIDYIRVLYSIAPDFIDKHIYEEMFKYDKEIAFIIKQEKIKC